MKEEVADLKLHSSGTVLESRFQAFRTLLLPCVLHFYVTLHISINPFPIFQAKYKEEWLTRFAQ